MLFQVDEGWANLSRALGEQLLLAILRTKHFFQFHVQLDLRESSHSLHDDDPNLGNTAHTEVMVLQWSLCM